MEQNPSMLHAAAKSDDVEAAELLLRENIDAFSKDKKGLTPLHILIQKRIDLFDSLQAKGYKGFEDNAVSPKENKIEMHSTICQKIRENEKFINMLLKHKSSTLEVQLLIFFATCTLSNSSTAEKLSEQLDYVNQSLGASSPIYPGYTALHFASHCNVNTVKMLLTKGANLLIQDSKGVTPLQICIKSFNLEDVHSILTGTSEWRYALFSDGNTKLVDYILSLCDADSHKKFLQAMDKNIEVTLSKDSSLWPEYTILHLAATLLPESSLEMIQDIVNINSNIIIVQDTLGSTAVHMAFRQNKLQVVELLLEHQPAAENPVDTDNLSHLHIAAAVDNGKLTGEILNNEENVNVTYKGEELPMVKLGWTPLHTAVHTEHGIIAKSLLEKGANFLQTDARGFTAIHLLLGIEDNMGGVTEFVFTSDKLEERVVENIGVTHLHAAVWQNCSDAVERLLDLGSDIEATIGKVEDEKLQKFEGCRPIHVTLIDQMESDAFAILVKRGADVFARKFDEPSALVEVFSGEDFEDYIEPIVDLLWGNKKLQLRMEEETGITMLHVLCYASDVEKIGELLQKGVDVNARIPNDSSCWPGFTPLHAFIGQYGWDGYEDLCSLLLKAGADFALTDAEGNTPVLSLLMTWKFANNETVCRFTRYLLKQQRDFSVNPTNKFGMSNFHVACLLNEVEMAKEFLKHSVVDVNQQISLAEDDEIAGKTPLHLAVLLKVKNYQSANRQIDMVSLLLEHGADVGAVDAFGRTVLHYIARCSQTRIVLLHKLSSYSIDINKRAKDGKTPMEILLSDRAPSSEIYFFIRQGARINSYNPVSELGYMAIFLENYEEKTDGSNHDYQDILEFMMDLCDITESSDVGRNAIHNVVSGKNTSGNSSCGDYVLIIEKFMDRRCDIFQQDVQSKLFSLQYTHYFISINPALKPIGRTPLHLAVKFKNAQAARALLKCGSDVNIADIRGNSPFACATELHEDNQKPWIVDWYSSDDDFYQDVCEILAVHLTKLQLVGLQVSELNAKLLRKVLSESEERDNEREIEIFFSHLEKAKEVRMYKSGFTVFDFLHPTLVVNSYSLLKQVDRDAIDCFFTKADYSEYDNLECFVRLQYNNARHRPSLIEPAVNGLRLLAGFPVPDLCIDIILKELTNLDLKNMIAAASMTEKREKIVN